MRIKVVYIDGRVEIYDSASMFNAPGLFGAVSGCTRFALRADDLSQGLWVSYAFADAAEPVRTRRENPCVPWTDEFDYQILNVDDLASVGLVEMDDSAVLYRVAGSPTLVNGPKFDMMSKIYGTTASGQSACDTAVDLYRVLHGETQDGADAAMPRHADETEDAWEARIADAMGWDRGALLDLVARAAAEEAKEAEAGVDAGADDGQLPPQDVLTATSAAAVGYGDVGMGPDMSDLEDGVDGFS